MDKFHRERKLVELGRYIEDDEMSMRLALRNLKNAAEEIILPKLGQVTDLRKYGLNI